MGSIYKRGGVFWIKPRFSIREFVGSGFTAWQV